MDEEKSVNEYINKDAIKYDAERFRAMLFII